MYINSIIVSKERTYSNHVGVLKILQKGIFNSRIPTLWKNKQTASINFCVSSGALSSKHPNRTSKATRAIAGNNSMMWLFQWNFIHGVSQTLFQNIISYTWRHFASKCRVSEIFDEKSHPIIILFPISILCHRRF